MSDEERPDNPENGDSSGDEAAPPGLPPVPPASSAADGASDEPASGEESDLRDRLGVNVEHDDPELSAMIRAASEDLSGLRGALKDVDRPGRSFKISSLSMIIAGAASVAMVLGIILFAPKVMGAFFGGEYVDFKNRSAVKIDTALRDKDTRMQSIHGKFELAYVPADAQVHIEVHKYIETAGEFLRRSRGGRDSRSMDSPKVFPVDNDSLHLVTEAGETIEKIPLTLPIREKLYGDDGAMMGRGPANTLCSDDSVCYAGMACAERKSTKPEFIIYPKRPEGEDEEEEEPEEKPTEPKVYTLAECVQLCSTVGAPLSRYKTDSPPVPKENKDEIVKTFSGSFKYEAQDTIDAIKFNLTKSAKTVAVTIKNKAGQTMRVIERGTQESGDIVIPWNMQDDYGEAVAAGEYTWEAKALIRPARAMGSLAPAGTRWRANDPKCNVKNGGSTCVRPPLPQVCTVSDCAIDEKEAQLGDINIATYRYFITIRHPDYHSHYFYLIPEDEYLEGDKVPSQVRSLLNSDKFEAPKWKQIAGMDTKTIIIEGGIALRKTAAAALGCVRIPEGFSCDDEGGSIKGFLEDKYCMIDKEGIDDTSEDYSSLMIEVLQRNNFRTMAEYEMTIDEIKLKAELTEKYENVLKEATNPRKNKCEVPE